MVHFSRLRLTGFKSFVDSTDLLIESGVTGIVGPNGCGKSNLVEALRWAMGENSPKSMDKIAQAEAEALAEVRSRAVDVAVAAAGRLIADNLDDAKSSEVMGRSIEEVKAKLN